MTRVTRGLGVSNEEKEKEKEKEEQQRGVLKPRGSFSLDCNGGVTDSNATTLGKSYLLTTGRDESCFALLDGER